MFKKTLQINEKKIFWTLLSILLLSICFYMYFINTTVRNVIATQNIESKISQLNLSISNKEFKYISEKNSINMNLAYSMGFKDASSKIYITEKSTKSVSLLSN